MVFNNQEILNQIVNPMEKAVFKSMRTDMETGKALLTPQQLGQFLRHATLNQSILKDATFDILSSFEKEYVQTGINGRVLQPGYDSEGNTNVNLNPADVDFDVSVLKTTKLKAMCSIQDDEKDDNIEKEQFEQTLLTMMGERTGEDLEVWNLFADSTLTDQSGDSEDKKKLTKFLVNHDGWLKQANQQLQSSDAHDQTGEGKADFAPTTGTILDMFDAMIYAMPLRLRQRNQLKFYVPFEVEDAYRNYLAARGTPLGDATQTGFAYPLSYKNIPIVNCQSFDVEDMRQYFNMGHCMLTNPKYLMYGIWKNLGIEPDRIPKHERTDYYYRLRAGNTTVFKGLPSVTAKVTLDELAEMPDAARI
ncbi:MAG: phage major capsid protein [Methanobrevibacter sp.]|uniref:phage major capsid protein n=1 Tax=Methanobrevibacter sp. TaxID=66852 RepID=UPI003EFC1A44